MPWGLLLSSRKIIRPNLNTVVDCIVLILKVDPLGQWEGQRKKDSDLIGDP